MRKNLIKLLIILWGIVYAGILFFVIDILDTPELYDPLHPLYKISLYVLLCFLLYGIRVDDSASKF